MKSVLIILESSILVYVVLKIKIVCSIYESIVIVVLSMGSNCDR